MKRRGRWVDSLGKPPSSVEPRFPPHLASLLSGRSSPCASRPAAPGQSRLRNGGLLPAPSASATPGPGLNSPSSRGAPAGGSHAIGRAEGRERRQGGGASTAQRGLIPTHSSHQCVVPLNPREPPSPKALLHFAEHELMRKKILLGRGQP